MYSSDLAIGNSGDPTLIDAVRERLDDASPLVRGMAAWAARRLMAPDAYEALAAERLASESDDDVCEEWSAPAS